MFETFSDIFSSRRSSQGHLDPRTKLILLGMALTLVLVSKSSIVTMAVFALSCAAILRARVPVSLILVRLIVPLLMVVTIVLLKTLTGGGPALASITIAHTAVALSRDGLSEGFAICSRVLGATGLVMLFGFTTPTDEILKAFTWARMPDELIETAMLVYRYIFVLTEQIGEIVHAQQVRLGYSGFMRSVSSAGLLTGAVVERSIDQAVRTAEAMRSRCFSGTIPVDTLGPMSVQDKLLIATSCVLCGAIYFLTGIATR